MHLENNRLPARVAEKRSVQDIECQHYNKILAGVQDGWIYYRCADCKVVIKVPQKKD